MGWGWAGERERTKGAREVVTEGGRERETSRVRETVGKGEVERGEIWNAYAEYAGGCRM